VCFSLISRQEVIFNWGTRQRSWLRHYATSQKVAGSIPDKIIAFFYFPNLSSRIMVLVSTQSLRKMITSNTAGG
jgi:hypothetical protein